METAALGEEALGQFSRGPIFPARAKRQSVAVGRSVRWTCDQANSSGSVSKRLVFPEAYCGGWLAGFCVRGDACGRVLTAAGLDPDGEFGAM